MTFAEACNMYLAADVALSTVARRLAALRERTGEPAYAPLFRSNRGTRLSYDAVHHQWAQACASGGLADDAGKPRHTRATELVEQGQRLEIVQCVLGHRDPRSTQGYAALEAL